MYNLMQKSDLPDRYPMNQLSDMLTNFIGVVFGCIVLIVGVTPLFCIMQIFLCFAEVYGHLSGGIFSYNYVKAKGKKTIYNPGLFTTVFGYLPIAVLWIISLFLEPSPTLWEGILAIPCSMGSCVARDGKNMQG